MEYKLTKHARERKEEYRIVERLIREALDNPTEISYDEQGHSLIKKLYRRRNGSKHVFIMVGVPEHEVFRVITMLTSSKVKKYLPNHG